MNKDNFDLFVMNASANFKLRADVLNDKAIVLWDTYEALVSFYLLNTGTVQVSYSMSLEKQIIAAMSIFLTKRNPNLTLGPPFFFDYRTNILHKDLEAIEKAKDSEFYFELIRKANE